MTRSYPSTAALTVAAADLTREYPDAADRIARALALARAGGVADTYDAPQDEHLLTRVSGRVLVYAPGTPYGWVCNWQDFYFGGTMRQLTHDRCHVVLDRLAVDSQRAGDFLIYYSFGHRPQPPDSPVCVA